MSSTSERLPEFDLAYLDNQGYTPLGELMRAIILRTVEDLNCEGQIYDEAVAYLNGNDANSNENEEEDYIFSFQSICSHLNICPEKTRYAILNAGTKISTRRRSV